MRPQQNVLFALWLLASYVDSFSGGVYRKSTVVQERMGGRTRLAAEAGEESVEALTRAAEELRKEAEAMEAALPQRSFSETDKDREEKQEIHALSRTKKTIAFEELISPPPGGSAEPTSIHTAISKQ